MQMSRSQAVVKREVQAALTTFDADNTGSLSFPEFLEMAMSPKHFKFRVPEDLRRAVIDLVPF